MISGFAFVVMVLGVHSQVPIPTAKQLQWLDEEIGIIVDFNMETFQYCGIGLSGVDPDTGILVPPPTTFAPTNVTTDQWVAGLASLGATRAVLVVSHGCGFNTFPSNTSFPEFGFEYNYSVKASPWLNGQGDVARMFVDSCKKYGIRPGFYNGIMNNAFLNVVGGVVQPANTSVAGQAIITQDQYVQIILSQLTQLWSNYGELAEVWFDGGYPEGTAEPIAALLQQLQPNAIAFQGPGANVIRWVGTESGLPSYPIWSTAQNSLDEGQGSFNSTQFVPAEADTCLQTSPSGKAGDTPYPGCWFFNQEMIPKPMNVLVATYHATVGQNANILLACTPNQTGQVNASHIEAYQQLGEFIRTCYGNPVNSSTVTGNNAVLDIGGQAINRVMIQEDLTNGQIISEFTIAVDGQNVFNGTCIGHKFIFLLESTVTADSVEVAVQQSAGTPTITVSAFNCTVYAPAASKF